MDNKNIFDNKHIISETVSEKILERILETIKLYHMLKPYDKVIVGLSGGADSVTLLHCLNRLKDTLKIQLFACHVNHNLRGEDSSSDQAFSQYFCKRLDIPLKVFSIDVREAAKKHKSIEETARELRYSAFAKMAAEIKENSQDSQNSQNSQDSQNSQNSQNNTEETCASVKIATAHNACDNGETVILNLVRGTGLKGLCGIPPVRENYIRPLINVTREEIEEYIKENGLQYVTDKTNFSTDYSRNKVRLEILPKLLEMNPSLYRGISRMSCNLRQENDFLEEMARSSLDDCRIEKGVYNTKKLAVLPNPILARAVSLMLWEKGVEPTALRINGFCGIIARGGGKINLEKNKFAVVKKGKAEIKLIYQNYRISDT